MKQTEIESELNTPAYDVERDSLHFARRVLVATLIVASVALLLLFVWFAADLLMLVFAGVLVSVLLRGLSELLQRRMGTGRWVSLWLAALSPIVLTALAAWLITGHIATQMADLQTQLPEAVQNVKNYFGQYDWARSAIDSLPNLKDWLASSRGTIVTRVTGLASITLGALVNLFVVIIIGLYLAFQPGLYSRGLKHLLPVHYRERGGEILDAIDNALRRWLIGRFGLMVINGALTAIGLRLLGVPLALTLGALAGLLNFVPNFGPWIAAIPAVLIAFLQGPRQALFVALLYFVVQSVDAYILTPLVDRKSVELPPVLTITAQVLLGAAFGFMGVLLASPLTAVALILVKMIYVEGVLGDDGGTRPTGDS